MQSVVSQSLVPVLWASTRRLLSITSTHAAQRFVHKPVRQHQPAHRPPQASSHVQAHSGFRAQQEFEDLITAIHECADERALSELVGQRVRDFSPAHTAAAFRRLAIICRLDKARPEQSRSEESSVPANTTFASWAAQNSVVAVKETDWSVPMCAQRRDVLHHLGLRVLETEGELRAREVACTLWALGSMNVVGGRNRLVEVLTRRLLAVARSFSPLQLSSTLWALARIRGSAGRAPHDEGMLDVVYFEVLLKAPLFSPQEVSNTLWALAKMGDVSGTAPVVVALTRRARDVAAAFNPQQLSNSLWALARLSARLDPTLLRAILAAAPPTAARFSPQELSNTLWALGRFNQAVPRALLAALSRRGALVAPRLNTPELTMALWGLARLSSSSSSSSTPAACSAWWARSLVVGLRRRGLELAGALPAHAIAPSLWALARISDINAGHDHQQPLLLALARRAMETDACAGFSRQEACNALWALARLQRAPSTPTTHPAPDPMMRTDAGDQSVGALTEALALRITAEAPRLAASDVAQVLWALARLPSPSPPPPSSQPHLCQQQQQQQQQQRVERGGGGGGRGGRTGREELLDRVEARALQVASGLSGQEVAQTLLALASLPRRSCSCSGSGGGAVLSSLCDQAALLSSLCDQAALLSSVCDQAARAAPRMSPQHIANVLWALGRLGLLPADSLLHALADRALLLQHSFQPQEVSSMLWAAGRLGLHAHVPELLHALARQASLLTGEMGAQGHANCLWALAALPPHPYMLPLLHALADHVSVERLRGVHRAQAHQFLLSARLDPALHALLPPKLAALAEAHGKEGGGGGGWREGAQEAAGEARPSQTQRLVARSLRNLHLPFREEACDAASGYSVDLLLDARSPLAPPPAKAAPAGWAIEVDGPPHFLLGSRTATGSTALKRRHLTALGYHLVSIPYWECDAAPQWGGREAYLVRKLQLQRDAPPLPPLPPWPRHRKPPRPPRPPAPAPAPLTSGSGQVAAGAEGGVEKGGGGVQQK